MRAIYFQGRIGGTGPRGDGYYQGDFGSGCFNIRFGRNQQCCAFETTRSQSGYETILTHLQPFPMYTYDANISGSSIVVSKNDLFEGTVSYDGRSITGTHNGKPVVLYFVEVDEYTGKMYRFYD